MAKQKTDLVSDMVDDDPDQGRTPQAWGAAQQQRIVAGQALPQTTAAPPSATPPASAADNYPWGFLIKHPGYGALRVLKTEARTLEEAKEVYRQRKCPHMTIAQLDETGFRGNAIAFRPAATEVGK